MALLDELVEEAYRLFAGYEMGDELAVSINDDNARWLKVLKPKEMSPSVVFAYTDSGVIADEALLIRQMKCLLPRILELMVEGDYLRLSLRKCAFRSAVWHAVEVNFVQRFALALFAHKFESYFEAAYAQDVLVMFHGAELDVMPLFDYWQAQIARPTVLWGLIQLVECCDADGDYGNSFLDEVLVNRMASWLNSAELRAAVNQSLLDHVDGMIVAGLAVWDCDKFFAWLGKTVQRPAAIEST